MLAGSAPSPLRALRKRLSRICPTSLPTSRDRQGRHPSALVKRAAFHMIHKREKPPGDALTPVNHLPNSRATVPPGLALASVGPSPTGTGASSGCQTKATPEQPEAAPRPRDDRPPTSPSAPSPARSPGPPPSTASPSTTPAASTWPLTAPVRSGAWNPDGDIRALARGRNCPNAVAIGHGCAGFREGNLSAVTFHGDVVELAGAAR